MDNIDIELRKVLDAAVQSTSQGLKEFVEGTAE